jgi:hypothetical protein
MFSSDAGVDRLPVAEEGCGVSHNSETPDGNDGFGGGGGEGGGGEEGGARGSGGQGGRGLAPPPPPRPPGGVEVGECLAVDVAASVFAR